MMQLSSTSINIFSLNQNNEIPAKNFNQTEVSFNLMIKSY
jgi:hypothetical protein